jgi:probable phosphoglycerate mutase
MILYFVRHGESEANLLHEVSNRGLKHPLTEKGRRQALELAQTFQSMPVSHIFCSPLLRAVQTAEILSTELNIPFTAAHALCEYDCGIIEGRSDEAAWVMWKELWINWEAGRYECRIEGGESFEDVKNRFVPFIESLLRRDSPGDVILVGHGGTYRFMLPLLGSGLPAGYTMTYTDRIIADVTPEGLFYFSPQVT